MFPPGAVLLRSQRVIQVTSVSPGLIPSSSIGSTRTRIPVTDSETSGSSLRLRLGDVYRLNCLREIPITYGPVLQFLPTIAVATLGKARANHTQARAIMIIGHGFFLSLKPTVVLCRLVRGWYWSQDDADIIGETMRLFKFVSFLYVVQYGDHDRMAPVLHSG